MTATLYSFPALMFRNLMKGTVTPRRKGIATVLKKYGYENTALLFGFFRALSNVYTGFAPLVALKLPSSLYNMLPYIISLVILAFISQKSRAPKAEGIPYDKGQR